MFNLRQIKLHFIILSAVIAFGLFASSQAFGATSITVIVGANGSGTQDANLTADGQILFADPDIGGNTLSTGALASINSFDILVEATSTIAFNDLGGTLTLQTNATFSTNTGGGGAINFANTANTLATSGGSITFAAGAGTNLRTANLNTAGGNILLAADNQDIIQNINAGTGVVTLQPSSNSQIINLGGPDAVGTLGLLDVELANLTAGLLRIGNTNNFGGITVSGGISRHAGYSVLSLRQQGSVNQTAALSVANLAIYLTTGVVTLTNAGNDVDTLAAVAAGGGSFYYTDSNGLTVDTVDFVTGIESNNDLVLTTGGALALNQVLHTPNTFIQLNAAGPVTEGASGQLLAPRLQLLGAGPFTLNNANDVGMIAANVTGLVNYFDANGLTIGSVNGTNGITTANKLIQVITGEGDLTVNNNVAAGTKQVVLASVSTGGSPDHILTNNAAITGASALLGGDRMAVEGGTINVGAGAADLTVTSLDRPLNLDNTVGDPNGEMRLSQTELNTVTAGVLRVGDLNITGDLTIKSALTHPATWNTLSLLTGVGGAISQNGGAILTVSNLFAAGAQSVTLTAFNNVSTVAGASLGPWRFKNNNNLVVGSVDPSLGGGFGVGINGGGPVLVEVVAVGDLLTVNQPINTTFFGFGTGINLFADNLTINAVVNAGSGTAYFDTEQLSRPITIGTKPGTSLGLLQSDFNQVTAGVVRIGDETTNTGGITITAPITAPATWNTLDLRQKAAFNKTGAGSLTVANLLFTDGTSAAHTWTISPSSVTQSPNSAIPISGVTNLTVTGGGGSDTFNATPGASTTMNINGGDPPPPASPGDTLNINLAGTSSHVLTANSTPSGYQGAYTFGNRKPINFTQMETLNPSCASPAATITCPGGVTKFADPGQNTATVNPGTPVVNGGCPPVTVTGVRSDGKPLSDPYPLGITTITWTATDGGNNSSSCSQTIVVLMPSGQRKPSVPPPNEE
jgi:hypothetical protein